ncbi:Histidine kinase-, DNA gyrase B-, and HSP90-like ATPase [compost metagenome]
MKREGLNTVITIRDNGVGMPPEKLAELRGRLQLRSNRLWTHGERIGLSNVASRIHLHFGEAYGITVDSGALAGTTVTVTIPFVKDGAEDV